MASGTIKRLAREKGVGFIRDEGGQEQPRNKERAQQVGRKDKGERSPGREALTR